KVFLGASAGDAPVGGEALYAFDASGATNCAGTPTVCQPLWRTDGTYRLQAVANGLVYATLQSPTQLAAFDVDGVPNCPDGVCQPVWTAPNASGVTMAIANGMLFTGDYVFDASGTTNCTTGAPRVCSYLAFLSHDSPGGFLAVANGSVYELSLRGPVSWRPTS